MATKRWIALGVAVALCLGLWGCEDAIAVSQEPLTRQPLTQYESLGVPSAKYYKDNMLARTALDMKIYDGRLYVGCGDYNENTGPTPVLSCPLEDLGAWQTEATLQEEQIGRFVTVGGRLVIPGFDPISRPEKGTYHRLVGGTWQTVSTLPHNLHHYDMVRYKGALFAALAAPRGKSPIAISRDGGKTYKLVRMIRDGKELTFEDSDFSRCYNFYEIQGELYADFRYIQQNSRKVIYDVYRYEKGAFVYVGDLNQKMQGGLYGFTTPPLWEKVLLGDTLYLTTGYLYQTQDMTTFTPVTITENAVIYDLYRQGRRMYVLQAIPKQGEGGYTVEICSIADPQTERYRTEVRFDYPVIPTALAVSKDRFFIAMGDWYKGADQNGTILCVNRE